MTNTSQPTRPDRDTERGTAVVTTEALRFLAPDFPGYGAENYGDFILELAPGLAGQITYVESHGNAPHTRFTITTPDGYRTSGVRPSALALEL